MLGVFIALSYGWYRYYSVKCNFVPNMTLLASYIDNQEKDIVGFWANIFKMLKCGYLPSKYLIMNFDFLDIKPMVDWVYYWDMDHDSIVNPYYLHKVLPNVLQGKT
jgi:hypothetical protein